MKPLKHILLIGFFSLGTLSCCMGHKEQEKAPIQSEVSTLSIDTLEHTNIVITPSIPLSSFDCLQLEIANKSTKPLPLNEFCIQIKEKDNWSTLFCDTVTTTNVLPDETKTIKVDLHLDEFQYSSKELYRFIAYYKKNNSVYQISKTYYSLTLFKKNGKVYMLPDTVIDN